MALLVLQSIMYAPKPIAQYKECSCGFRIKYYLAGKYRDEWKEIKCPICGNLNKVKI